MAQELLAELGGATSPVEAAVIMLMERMDSVESSAERLERWRTSIQGAGPELAALLRPKASSVDAEDSAERARLYGALVALQPQDAEAQIQFGWALCGSGRFAEALPAADAALAAAPDDVTALYLRGIALSSLGRNEEALAALDAVVAALAAGGRSVTALPDVVSVQATRGDVCYCLGRFDDALAAADAILSVKSGDLNGLCLRIIALHGLGRTEEAYAVGRRVLQPAAG